MVGLRTKNVIWHTPKNHVFWQLGHNQRAVPPVHRAPSHHHPSYSSSPLRPLAPSGDLHIWKHVKPPFPGASHRMGIPSNLVRPIHQHPGPVSSSTLETGRPHHVCSCLSHRDELLQREGRAGGAQPGSVPTPPSWSEGQDSSTEPGHQPAHWQAHTASGRYKVVTSLLFV